MRDGASSRGVPAAIDSATTRPAFARFIRVAPVCATPGKHIAPTSPQAVNRTNISRIRAV